MSELAEPFDMALPSFVQHLRVLEDAGVVHSDKVGRVRTCRLEAQALAPAEEWLADRRRLLEGRLDALEDYLAGSRRPARKKGKRT